LGSCTMKYNPKICEEIASWNRFMGTHPLQDVSTVQGNLQIMFELERMLCEITGMDYFSLQPAAGAQGEFLGMLLTRAYHEHHGNDQRNEVILPDTAHGTNPASVTMAGYKLIEIPSTKDGTVDLEMLEKSLSEKTACFMLTNPNTLGIFESEILEISKMVHDAGALLYYDGANMNAIMGKARPGDMGFDVVHLNLHKTFATPHGGGGPGSGPVGVISRLIPFLPVPTIGYDIKKDYYYLNYDHSDTIGKVRSYFGNFSILLRAYTYILRLGKNGLTKVSELANLNANYMKTLCKEIKGFSIPYGSETPCMHEFVLSAKELGADTNVCATDVSKFLLDEGLHPPTIYFPLIVPEALMIEPTETEPIHILDDYISTLKVISDEAYKGNSKEILLSPRNTSVGRIDDVRAARNPILSYRMLKQQKMM
ncbi:MAG: aminomethyl-transferring glycine dehydrogenase subunit GcvPB, partial [Candidatus Heimdallarchaeota archaeon]|nr:aminomethyl-transferring glycine dehydrogenase subunit GcvPB [Candidatus Heimdallarchaeota archaeon]